MSTAKAKNMTLDMVTRQAQERVLNAIGQSKPPEISDVGLAVAGEVLARQDAAVEEIKGVGRAVDDLRACVVDRLPDPKVSNGNGRRMPNKRQTAVGGSLLAVMVVELVRLWPSLAGYLP